MEAKVNGISVYYESQGDGPPLLLVHGFPLRGEMWAEVIAPLRRDYRLIIPDLRGHGRSSGTPSWTMADFADDLAALLDHLGESRSVVVIGLSMGGYIALEFHRRHGPRVRSLVLVDTRAEADASEAAKGRHETAEKVLREGSRIVADAMIGKLFAPRAPNELKEVWHQFMSQTNPPSVAAALRAMAGRADSIPTLKTLKVPALIVVGEEDAITPPDCARRMHEAATGSRLMIVPGAGHMVPLEAGPLFVSGLRDFLASLPDDERHCRARA